MVVAHRQLRRNHPKALIRKYMQDGEVGTMPSSVVVVDRLLAMKDRSKLKRSCAYLTAVHDWQVMPARFWTNGKKGSRSVLGARQCRRRNAGKGGLLDVNGRPAIMLSQSSQEDRHAVAVRGRKALKNQV